METIDIEINQILSKEKALQQWWQHQVKEVLPSIGMFNLYEFKIDLNNSLVVFNKNKLLEFAKL